MFNAYLYGVEAWWKIDEVSEKLLKLERKILKAILCVKPGTPNDIVYLELNRADIMATVKQRQYSFFRRLLDLGEDEAVVRKIVGLFRNLPICQYYDHLNESHVSTNKTDRLDR